MIRVVLAGNRWWASAPNIFPKKGFAPIICQGLTNEMEKLGKGGKRVMERAEEGKKRATGWMDGGEQRQCLYLREPVDAFN